MSDILEGTPEFNRGHNMATGPDWSHLDGQEYQPAPIIVPDTRTGFDQSGDYHALAEAVQPFRWAHYLQDAIDTYTSTFDYTVGSSERDDIAQDIIGEWLEENAFDDPQLVLSALDQWRKVYGNKRT